MRQEEYRFEKILKSRNAINEGRDNKPERNGNEQLEKRNIKRVVYGIPK